MEQTEYVAVMRDGTRVVIGANTAKEIRSGNHVNFFRAPTMEKPGEQVFFPIHAVDKIIKTGTMVKEPDPVVVSGPVKVDDYKPVNIAKTPEEDAESADRLKAEFYALRKDKAAKSAGIIEQVKRGPGRPPKVLAEIEEVVSGNDQGQNQKADS